MSPCLVSYYFFSGYAYSVVNELSNKIPTRLVGREQYRRRAPLVKRGAPYLSEQVLWVKKGLREETPQLLALVESL